ncbi:hypothetical protein [Nannocystis pusilla]|uniref:Uncharacterized protein n=1 Tax=Nannocystis pusilla TaxID=889268 RepID=A0ABS7TN60_9BACT|nr:hypothetical protein [Nannocystis pusilla]MBZ5709669.1 hypothetical protein [Nannocystis pusilla]
MATTEFISEARERLGTIRSAQREWYSALSFDLARTRNSMRLKVLALTGVLAVTAGGSLAFQWAARK